MSYLAIVEDAYRELQEYCENRNLYVSELKTYCDRVAEEKRQLEATISILESKVEQLNDEVETHKRKEGDMEKQLSSASTESESAKTKYDQLVSYISKLEEESESLREK